MQESLINFAKHSILDTRLGSQYTSDNIREILKMNQKKKTQPPKRHYGQHRVLVSLLF